MDLSVGLVVLVLPIAVFALARAVRRARTLCELDVTNGIVTVVRGQLAPRLVADLGDITNRPKVGRATIRLLREQGRARVVLDGSISPAQAQQIRNVIGSVPYAKLGSGGRRK